VDKIDKYPYVNISHHNIPSVAFPIRNPGLLHLSTTPFSPAGCFNERYKKKMAIYGAFRRVLTWCLSKDLHGLLSHRYHYLFDVDCTPGLGRCLHTVYFHTLSRPFRIWHILVGCLWSSKAWVFGIRFDAEDSACGIVVLWW